MNNCTNKKSAAARIHGSCDYKNIKGTVLFRQGKCGTIVTAEIWGLPNSCEECKNNIFAFHIHSGSECSGNKTDPFANAGMHYNPNDCDHPNHAGDLPPLFANNGYAYLSTVINRFTVDEIIGKTVIIHQMPDDFTTQPSGNSGKKIACGEIKG